MPHVDIKCENISSISPSLVHHLYGNLEHLAFTVHGYN